MSVVLAWTVGGEGMVSRGWRGIFYLREGRQADHQGRWCIPMVALFRGEVLKVPATIVTPFFQAPPPKTMRPYVLDGNF